MVDFSPPFGQDGDRRLPTATEQQLGFPCGPATRELFNGLFWLLQGQIKDIADEAGVTPNQDGDITLLKRAVLELISSATGGNPDGYILMTQARARLPIYPDVLHDDMHLGVLSPSTGVVRVPAGRDFVHRGIFRVTTAETDFNTDPSKTYHLRWNPNDGFTLNDLASGTYNPTVLAEINPVFDSTYDDMLVARVVTNSSNVVTVTNLKNRARLSHELTNTLGMTNAINWTQLAGSAVTLNWSRAPRLSQHSLQGIRAWIDGAPGAWTAQYGAIAALQLRQPLVASRYGAGNLEYIYDDTTFSDGRVFYGWTFMAD